MFPEYGYTCELQSIFWIVQPPRGRARPAIGLGELRGVVGKLGRVQRLQGHKSQACVGAVAGVWYSFRAYVSALP